MKLPLMYGLRLKYPHYVPSSAEELLNDDSYIKFNLRERKSLNKLFTKQMMVITSTKYVSGFSAGGLVDCGLYITNQKMCYHPQQFFGNEVAEYLILYKSMLDKASFIEIMNKLCINSVQPRMNLTVMANTADYCKILCYDKHHLKKMMKKELWWTNLIGLLICYIQRSGHNEYLCVFIEIFCYLSIYYKQQHWDYIQKFHYNKKNVKTSLFAVSMTNCTKNVTSCKTCAKMDNLLCTFDKYQKKLIKYEKKELTLSRILKRKINWNDFKFHPGLNNDRCDFKLCKKKIIKKKLVCKGCKIAKYCSRRHQKMHWQMIHRVQCL